MIVGARQGWFRVSQENADLGFSHATVSRVCREWCEKQNTSSEQQFCEQIRLFNERGQRRRARLVKADGKVTGTQITTQYLIKCSLSVYYPPGVNVCKEGESHSIIVSFPAFTHSKKSYTAMGHHPALL